MSYYQSLSPYSENRPVYQNMNNQQQPYRMIRGYLVQSIEEVKNAMIDLDGSIFYFPDQVNHKIYTKQINLNGEASINEYILMERTNPQIKENTGQASPLINVTPVSKQEFDSVINSLKEEIELLKGASAKNDESTNDNGFTKF